MGIRTATRAAVAGLVAVVVLVPSSGANASETIGEAFTPDPNGSCGGDGLVFQTSSPGARYAAPEAGVINSWTFTAASAPGQVGSLKLKVGRVVAPNTLTIAGESPLVTPVAGRENTYPVQIPVAAGDLLGLYIAEDTHCLRDAPSFGYTILSRPGDAQVGSTVALQSPKLLQLDVEANLETDECNGRPPTIAGTIGEDVLVGTPGPDVIIGLGGRDRIRGLGGRDRICGGTGGDKLVGGKGRDKLLGQGGKDKLRGGKGKDLCKGGRKDDSAKGCERERSI